MIPRPSSLLRRLGALFARLAREQDSGQAMTEFIIVFPLQLLFILGIMQLSLIYVAHIVLNHAAHAACRAVLVTDAAAGQDPQEQGRRAAQVVLSSVAGPTSRGGSGGVSASVPGWGALARSRDAYAKTRVQIVRNDDVVQVALEHDLELRIPVAGRFFAIPETGFVTVDDTPAGSNGEGAALTQRYGAPHITISESCRMVRPWHEESP